MAMACVGCGPSGAETEAGMTEFIKSCKAPVSGKLVLSQFNNSVELTCAEFRPHTKAEVHK
jgi:hypothetical protein